MVNGKVDNSEERFGGDIEYPNEQLDLTGNIVNSKAKIKIKSNKNIDSEPIEDTNIIYNIGDLVLEDNFDAYLNLAVIKDRSKVSTAIKSIMDSPKEMSDFIVAEAFNKNLVQLKCNILSNSIIEDCIKSFSRHLSYKAWVIDDCLINKGLDIFEVLLKESGFSNQSSIMIDMRKEIAFDIFKLRLDSIKLGQSIALGSEQKTYNVQDITKNRLQKLGYETGISDSGLCYVSTILALCFSKNIIKNVHWFNDTFTQFDENNIRNNFTTSQAVTKIFFSAVFNGLKFEKGLLKSLNGCRVAAIYQTYINNIYEYQFNPQYNNMEKLVRLYSLLRKADKLRLLDDKMHKQLKSDVSILKDIKKKIRDKNKK